MNIRVKLFASLREAAGRTTIDLALPDGASVADALAALDGPLRLAAQGTRVAVAVNRRYAEPGTALHDGDELALLPPVSGGQEATRLFEITTAPLSLDDVAARVSAPAHGAITVFAGVVRGETGPLTTDYLEYEAYPEMAEATFAQIAGEVQERWPAITAVAIVHRTGRMEVGEASVVIAIAAAHRADTFDASRYAIDRLKAIAPIWKKEVGSDGSFWVEGPE
jgi:molybdopterin synthase catalytic subunit